MKKKLKKYIYWNETIAQNIAKNESIDMTKDHWEVIYAIRDFYFKFNLTPSIIMLIKFLNKRGSKKINTCYLFKLFPVGPVKQASKIAGIPEPSSCL